MHGLSAVAFGVASAAVVASTSARCAQAAPSAPWPESLALGGAASLALLGIAASLLGLFGIFDAVSMTLVAATLAAMMWPRDREALGRVRWTGNLRRGTVWVLILLGAVALRLPATDASLAGRDQGTYLLRSQALARTGAHSFVDPILRAAADAQPGTRGAADLLGLHPKRSEAWRAGVYEAAYRPGWYLADRDRGVVVPQFLHLHPSLLASYSLVAGEHAVTLGVVLHTLLLLMLMLAIGRRLFGQTWLVGVPVIILAASPLAIWVHRTPLSETPCSVLLWGAVLAALRTRDHEPTDLDLTALLLGAMAWTRGNAWLAMPVILATLWLLPGHAPRRRRPVAILTAVAVGAVFAHAGSTYPYLIDEFAKQMWRGPMPSPGAAVAVSLFGALVWWLVDATSFHRRGDSHGVASIRKLLPITLTAGCAVATATYLWLGAVSPPSPYARLEAVFPTFGPILLVLGAIAIPSLAARTRLTRARDVWLAAIAASVVVNLLLYAQRNLPAAGLYYYGRYVVPDLLPLFALLATASVLGVQSIARTASARLRVSGHPGRWPLVLPGALAGLLVGSVAYPLVTSPIVRHQEFGGSGRITQRIANVTGPNATIIAGGEGWHAGHTFNQVGGALQMGHGLTVLPYHSREAFYATAYALLASNAGPEAPSSPRTYLLLAEATHHHDPEDGGPPVAAFDDLLPPPFVARRVEQLELYSDRLTPSVGRQPGRVTRDQLRMTLVELAIDPRRAGERRFAVSQGGRLTPLDGSTGPPACLTSDAPLSISLPAELSGTGSIVIVMAPGTANANKKLTLYIDGQRRYAEVPGGSPRPGDTLGPFLVDGLRHEFALTGSARSAGQGVLCPHGGIVEVRWLGPDRHMLAQAVPSATSFAPPADLGQPTPPHRWVAGRGLSRHRPLLDPHPTIEGLTLRLDGSAPINFAPEQLPGTPGQPLDLIVTLTTTQLSEDAQLVVFVDGRPIGRLRPPASSTRSWQSDPLTFVPASSTARFSLALDTASETDVVRVRDIGLFSRSIENDLGEARVH